MELAAPEIVRILIGRAQCGDGSMEAAKYILERVADRRGRLVEIEAFPEIRTPADVPAALASLAAAVGGGIITIEEATAAGSLLKTFLDTYETAHRLAKSLPAANAAAPKPEIRGPTISRSSGASVAALQLMRRPVRLMSHGNFYSLCKARIGSDLYDRGECVNQVNGSRPSIRSITVAIEPNSHTRRMRCHDEAGRSVPKGRPDNDQCQLFNAESRN